jgi:cobalt-zinc-cadmium efflux system membrane fusion protein
MIRSSRPITGIAMVLTGLTAWGCTGDPPAPPSEEPTADGVVQLTEAQERVAGIVTQRSTTGEVRVNTQVPGSVGSPDTASSSIGSIVDGRVAVVHVLPGDEVQTDAPLVEIHSHELTQAQRDFAAAEAAAGFNRNAVERSEALLEAGAVSLEEVQRRRADLVAAEADLRRAEEMIEHLNPSASGNVTAIAPMEGTVFNVHVRAGQAVVPGTPLVDMGSTDVLWVTAFVPEDVATSVAVGDTVDVRFRVPEEVAPARVIRLGGHVDPMNRSVEMRFELLRIPAGVRPGTFALVEVPSTDVMDGIEVPEEAAVSVAGRDVVFVSEGSGAYRAIDVTAFPLGNGRVAVTGVPPGSEIVTEGAYFLKAALEQVAEAGGAT